jgi:uncharacterized membrane protein YdjX (TVP38/TMEM64 family)
MNTMAERHTVARKGGGTYRRSIIRWGLLGLVLAGAALGLILQSELRIVDVRDGFAAAGVWAPLLFICVYVLATLVSLPGPVLTITGGMLFGIGWGTTYSLTGALIGGVIAFLIARYLARDWFEARLGPRLQPVKHGVDDEGWRFVLLARLMPVVPYAALNYGFGLTRIKTMPYALASLVGMAPATFVYTYLGEVGVRLAEGGHTGLRSVLFAIGLVALLLLAPRLIRRVQMHRERQRQSRTDVQS